CRADGFPGCQRTGYLKRHFRRVPVVVAAVVERYLDVRHREPGQDSAFQRFPDTRLGRLDIFLRYAPAGDVVHKLNPAARKGLDADLHVAVLAVAAGLLDVAPLGFRVLADGLAI